ncbi:MAG: hypothetical protein FWH37_09710 [Candidatus Bathyarchaeota archaeon]|nr:hypothetical protein [Candidatus Termiticorpusculum sp.]
MTVAKWIGTLAPTILFGVLTQFNIFIVLMGIVCSVFDIISIVALCKWQSLDFSNQTES